MHLLFLLSWRGRPTPTLESSCWKTKFTENALHVAGNAKKGLQTMHYIWQATLRKKALQTTHHMWQAMLRKKVYKQCTACGRQCWKTRFTNNARHVAGNAITWAVSVIKGDNQGAVRWWTLHNLSQDKKTSHQEPQGCQPFPSGFNCVESEYNTGLPFLRSPPRGHWSTIADGCKLYIRGPAPHQKIRNGQQIMTVRRIIYLYWFTIEWAL